MRKTKKRDPFATADVVVMTDNDDTMVPLTEPGTYALMDIERGVCETIEVGADGSRRVIKTVPFGDTETRIAAARACVPAPFALIHYEVGKPLVPDQIRFSEGTQLEITPGGLTFFQFIEAPTEKEAASLERGRIAMRIVSTPRTLMVLLRCGDGHWADAAYSVHRVPQEYRVCPSDPGEGYGWLAMLVLVDARTGIVRSLRRLAMSRRFSCALLRAFEQQKALPADDEAHARDVAWFQRKSPSALAAEAIDRFEQGDTKN